MTTLAENGCNVFLEIGPSPVLTAMGQRCVTDTHARWLASLQPPRAELEKVLTTLAQLWTRGVAVDWEGFDRGLVRHRVALPTYRFQRSHYWVGAPHDGRGRTAGDRGHPLLGDAARLGAARAAVRVDVLAPRAVVQRRSHLARYDHRVGRCRDRDRPRRRGRGGWAPRAGSRSSSCEEPAALPADQTWVLQTVVAPTGTAGADVTVFGRPRSRHGYWQELATARAERPGRRAGAGARRSRRRGRVAGARRPRGPGHGVAGGRPGARPARPGRRARSGRTAPTSGGPAWSCPRAPAGTRCTRPSWTPARCSSAAPTRSSASSGSAPPRW